MIWDDMLSSGRKLTGKGGSDSHHGVPDTNVKLTTWGLHCFGRPGRQASAAYAA